MVSQLLGVVRAASTESERERAERVRRGRFFRTCRDPDGAGHGSFLLPPAEFTRFMASVESKKRTAFEQARKAGPRDNDDAYAGERPGRRWPTVPHDT